MRVVITGGSGFIGQRLAAVPPQHDCEIVVVSRDATPGCVQVHSYAHMPQADVIVHLAQSSDRVAVNRQGEAGERDALSLMDVLLARPFVRFVYASSAALYGDDVAIARKPTDPVHAVDTYTRVKYESERRVLETGRGVVARLANIYGRGMSPTNVVSKIISQIPGEGPLRVHDTGPVRDFLHCNDAVDALMCLIRSAATGVFNVGTGVGTSIGDLARIALNVANERHRLVVASGAIDTSSRLVLDCASTAEVIGWEYRIALPQGLRQLLDESDD